MRKVGRGEGSPASGDRADRRDRQRKRQRQAENQRERKEETGGGQGPRSKSALEVLLVAEAEEVS